MNEDLKAIHFSSKTIENKIKKFKYKADMVILGFLNSETIAKYFIENQFKNVVYLKNVVELIKLFNTYPYFYYYFQRCLNSFIVNFVSSLYKKSIKEAFIDSKKEFKEQLLDLKHMYPNISDDIFNVFRHDIIEYETEENDKMFFDDLKLTNSSSSLCSSSSFITISKNNSENFESNESINFNEFNLKFSDDMDNKDKRNMKYLINKRYYGNKKILKNAINQIFEHRRVNIFGEKGRGKTSLCLELCKYFYINNYFKKGIYYISNKNKKSMEEFEEVINTKNTCENNESDNNLIIIDIKDNLNDYLQLIFNSTSHFVFVTDKQIKEIKNLNDKTNQNKSQKSKKKKKDKNNKKKITSEEAQNKTENICYIDLNINLTTNLREELVNYNYINRYMDEKDIGSSKTPRELLDSIQNKEKVYIDEILNN